MDVKNKDGNIDFIYGYKKIMEFLPTIGTDTDMNGKNEEGNTVLMWATKKGYKDIVELLLAKGANVHIRDNDDFTALMWAAWNGNKDIVELLLANGADINEKNNE